MKKLSYILAALVTGTLMSGAVLAQQNLIYVSVESCRVADTRQSEEGVITANTHRNFRVTGNSSELASQGGTVNCANPRPGQTPVSVAAYVLAVPNDSSSGKGVLSAYPSDDVAPPVGSGSTVNFADGQTIGNTTIAPLCTQSCPTSGELAVLSRNSDRDVVIDVLGYFFPTGYEVVRESINPGVAESVNDYEVQCPQGKRPYGGGFSAADMSETINLWGSAPNNSQQGWLFTYFVAVETSSVTFSVVCGDG